MITDDKIRDKNYNMILTKKQQRYQHYHQLKLISTNILQVKEYYTQIKEEWHSKQSMFSSWWNIWTQIKTAEDEGKNT